MGKLIAIVGLLFLINSKTQAQAKQWSLRECVDHAVENNLDVKLSELNVQSSEVDILDAKSTRLPDVSANLNHSWNIGLNQDITTGVNRNQTTQFTSAGLGASWTAYNGKQNLLQIAQAETQQLARQYELDGIKDDIRLNVANAYLQVVFNRENLKVLESQYASTLIEKERIETLIEGGALASGEIYETEATLASQEQSITQAENSFQLAKIALAQLLQINDYENFEIADEDYTIPSSDILAYGAKGIYDKALGLRNDIKLGEKNIELSETSIELAKRAKLPTVNLFYNYSARISYEDQPIGMEMDPNNPYRLVGVVESTGENVISQNFRIITGKHDPILDQWFENDGHNFGFQIAVPIYSGNRNNNNIERNKINLAISKQQQEQRKWQLESTINQVYYDALNSAKAYEAAQKTLEARQAAYDIMRERFEAGTSNSFDFNQSKQRVTEAEGQVVSAKYDYIFRLKVLEFYFGIELD